MYNNYQEYVKYISHEIQKIPHENELFWGMWICENLYKQCKEYIYLYFPENEALLINNSMDYLWKIVDEGLLDKQETKFIYEKFQQIDETFLDETDIKEKCIYETFIILNGGLEFVITSNGKWKYNVIQSNLDYLDVVLDNEGLNILNEKDFSNKIVENDIESQLKMIEYLKINTCIASKDKNLFRY